MKSVILRLHVYSSEKQEKKNIVYGVIHTNTLGKKVIN